MQDPALRKAAARSFIRRFGLWSFVGTVCFGCQVWLLHLLHHGDSAIVSGAIAYLATGFLSFVLHSLLTFRDRHPSLNGIFRRWVKFFATNISAALVNGCILHFWPFGPVDVVAVLTANVLCLVLNLTSQWLFVYRPHPSLHLANHVEEIQSA